MTRTEIYSMMSAASNSIALGGTMAGEGWPNAGACGGVRVRGHLGKMRDKAHGWTPTQGTDTVDVWKCSCGAVKTVVEVDGKTYARYF